MSKNRKVTKINPFIKINAATIIIAAIFLYVCINIFLSAKKEPITTYKVNKSNVNNDIVLNGLIVRSETVINATSNGYVCYYVRDGEKVANNSALCTVDASGQISTTINDAESYDEMLTDDDYTEIRNTISTYKSDYSNNNFIQAYNFENNINNKVVELTNEILMKQFTANGTINSTATVKSPSSGIVTYYTDGYESFDINSVSAESFDKSTYTKQTLKTGDMISAGDALVKIISDETWYIVAPITDEQIAAFTDDEYVSFKLNNSSFDMTMPYEIMNQSDGKYIKITLSKYMVDFIDERFISVELMMDEDTGLKVPNTSLVDKDVYIIPNDYLSAGGNQTSVNRINVKAVAEDGSESLKQVTATIYQTNENDSYVDAGDLTDSDVIFDIDSKDSKAVSTLEKTTIQGVYSATRGTAEFRKVTIKKTVDDFTLIESGESITAYDNIILDSSQVTEGQIIY